MNKEKVKDIRLLAIAISRSEKRVSLIEQLILKLAQYDSKAIKELSYVV